MNERKLKEAKRIRRQLDLLYVARDAHGYVAGHRHAGYLALIKKEYAARTTRNIFGMTVAHDHYWSRDAGAYGIVAQLDEPYSDRLTQALVKEIEALIEELEDKFAAL